MELLMNKINRSLIASILVILAIFFIPQYIFGQIPKLLLKFVEKQDKVKSGYVKLQSSYFIDNDTIYMRMVEDFFISTPKDLKFIAYHNSRIDSSIYCKSANILVTSFNRKDHTYNRYWYEDDFSDAKHDPNFSGNLSYPTDYGFTEQWKNCKFKRISPKINKKNIRYKIFFPDDDICSNRFEEWEFNSKTFNLIQEENSLIYFKTELMYHRMDIFECQPYEYIHSDILDTISFMFEKIRKGYDLQYANEQSKKDSVFREHFCDSVMQSVIKGGSQWIENSPQVVKQDTLFFMPEWKLPLLSGDTIYSDSIKSRFLLIDMWYVSCHPCRIAMLELSSIDTLYDESLLKMASINASDEDTAIISKVLRNLNLKCDVACAYGSGYDMDMAKKMGSTCRGYPQLYLIDMKTKQVIWNSCGWYEGFTKDVEKIIKAKNVN